MNVSFCLQKNRENNRKTKVGSKKPKFRKTLEEALLLYFQKGIRKSSFSCMSTGHSGKMQFRMRMEKVLGQWVNLKTNIREKITSKQQSTSSSAHRHRLRQKWTKREAPMPFQPVRQQRKRII
ncbi:Protein CBG22883 [Caenorhabditis briggsae]|uniref:Protein CBG22883 n=1 Tax=Caenorhabditis briggsae TaxID=6238 RepID=A8Y3A5_CAEBR|nr:Protein CBG22883 [Caenorhabditis briggsae]CAP39374.1 Protein CBG22883 [Caenorhabditis briggsae]